MKLMIVESPSKIWTLSKFLDSSWVIKASIGHIRDMPTKSLGYSIDQGKVQIDYELTDSYQTEANKKKNLSDLKKLSKSSEMVYLATDPDREGEAIAWHLKQVLNLSESSYERITFQEISKEALFESLKHPRKINMDLVNAQQTRRVIDRIIGYKTSSVLRNKMSGKVSAGRVQSPAVRLIKERDDAINSFKSQSGYSVMATFSRVGGSSGNLSASLHSIDKKTFSYENSSSTFCFSSEDEVGKLIKVLKSSSFKISDVECKRTKKNPFPPFITSTLQRAASTVLKFPISKTTKCAQKLYEAGLVTYIRTDSPSISDGALQKVRSYIGEKFESQYLPNEPHLYKSKAGAQEAHECIRPKDIDNHGDDISDGDEQKLYRLIHKQFVSSQMSSATFFSIKCDIFSSDDRYHFISKGRVMEFDGWTKLNQGSLDSNLDSHEIDTDSMPLPDWVSQGLDLSIENAFPWSKKTKAPPRYTESKLVADLERFGIGRPSTYAAILSNITGKKYIKQEKMNLFIEKSGVELIDMLLSIFQESWLETGYTKDIECRLDMIAEGKENWEDLICEVDHFIDEELKKANQFKDIKIGPQETDEFCAHEGCNGSLIIINGKHGPFKKCSKCDEIAKSMNSIGLECPKCSSDLTMNRGGIFCTDKDCCDFKVFRKRNNKNLSDEDLMDLLTKGKTKKISGFKSKEGKSFSGVLLLTPENTVDWLRSA